jgi:hypothetical protein
MRDDVPAPAREAMLGITRARCAGQQRNAEIGDGRGKRSFVEPTAIRQRTPPFGHCGPMVAGGILPPGEADADAPAASRRRDGIAATYAIRTAMSVI